MGQQKEIVIFMSLDTPDDYMAVMESDLDAMDGLGEITYVSRDQAFEDYKEKLGDKADILDGMGGRPLSAGKFRVKIDAPEDLDVLLTSIRRMDYVDEVQAPTDLQKPW